MPIFTLIYIKLVSQRTESVFVSFTVGLLLHFMYFESPVEGGVNGCFQLLDDHCIQHVEGLIKQGLVCRMTRLLITAFQMTLFCVHNVPRIALTMSIPSIKAHCLKMSDYLS